MADKLRDKLTVMAVSRDYNTAAMRQLHVFKYPTIRLYKGQGEDNFVEYTIDENGKNLNEKNFVEFLKANGIESKA